MLEKKGLWWCISLEDMDVEAHLMRRSLNFSSSDLFTVTASSLTFWTAWNFTTSKFFEDRAPETSGEKIKASTDQCAGFPVAFHDDVGADTFFDERLALSQQLGAENDYTRCAVSDFCVLRSRDVDEGLGGRMNDLEELHDRRAVVGDRGIAIGLDAEETSAPVCATAGRTGSIHRR